MVEKQTLKEGEIICPKCNGTGGIESGSLRDAAKTCRKCFGDGKLDWIEAAMGKVRRMLQGKWTVDYSEKMKCMFSSDLEKEMRDVLGSEIAKDIDKEIMNELVRISVVDKKIKSGEGNF
jgi:DnaJ-class molecular chaperone